MMKLNLDQISKICSGAVKIEEENGLIKLYRFTEEQQDLYKSTSDDFYAKSFSSSGIKLVFKTDSQKLFMKFELGKGSSRSYFSFDVFVDDRLVGCIDNFSESDLHGDYTKDVFPSVEASGMFELGSGEKKVCIYLPWSKSTAISEISVDDGSFIEAVKQGKKLLAFGDSITQGYDALRPSDRYVAQLADRLGADEYNKAIGGEIFFPDLAKCKEDFIPDYITVAYGTNDWKLVSEQTFRKNCKEFFENLRDNYPETPIIAITPIWRKDMNEETEFGEFKKVDEIIRETAEKIDKVNVVCGFCFVPEDEAYFADLKLHPNDIGFRCYFENLCTSLGI